MGMKYYEQDELDQAISEFKEAIALDPNNAEAHRNLGTAYGEQGKWEESVLAYKQAIELVPDYGEAYGDIAAAYFNTGKLEEAMAAAKKGIELAPDYAMAYNNLGVIYGAQGQVDTAISLFEQGLQADPDCADAHYNLGFAYENQEQLDKAIAAYQEAVRADPDYLDAYENMGTVYARQGRLEEAMAQFKTFLQLAPDDDPDRTQVEGWLAELERATADAGSEYSNAKNGYSLSYPADWYHIEDGDRVSFAESKEAYQASALESPLVTILVAPLTKIAQGFGLEAGADPTEFLQVMTQRTAAQVEKMENVQIAGYPAAVALTSGTVMNSPYKGNMIIILAGERFFLAEGIAPPDQWDSFRPTFVNMINSLAFFEPGGSDTSSSDASSVDFSDPASVLQAVFTAAQTEDFSVLSSLCDPQGENDDDTTLICAITSEHPNKDSFIEYFAHAKITGDAVIEGNRAEIPFLFGPDGDKEETMGLVQRDGKWYLADF